MKNIKIDGVDYDYDQLSEGARKQLQCIQFVDAELVRLEANIAIYKTARIGYVRALNHELQPPSESLVNLYRGDTVKLS